VYKNEANLGKIFGELLPKHGLKREDLFITTKVAMHNQGTGKCSESLEQSMADLQTNYLDLVLIHWPGVRGLKPEDAQNARLRQQTYSELETMHLAGQVRLVGISNYTIRHINELLGYCRVRPNLLQVSLNRNCNLPSINMLYSEKMYNLKSECHPLLAQRELIQFCEQNSIAFQAYSSMGTSDQSVAKSLTENEVVRCVAARCSKTPAQILLKWSVQRNIGTS
jgi:diketogulonate reductase-like aldo/keto reductase